MTFIEKWLEAVERKNSVLCAGLDPAEFDMGRGEKGLPRGTDKKGWAIKYIEAVAPFCAALKPNTQYWKDDRGMSDLSEIIYKAGKLGLVVIEDSKLADIGSTNDAGVYYANKKDADAVTFSPFAGNMREAAEQARKRDLGLISMVLMSNPEFEREKNKLVPLDKDEGYLKPHLWMIEGQSHVKQYIQLAHDAAAYGVEGVVIGAPSQKNHIKPEEIERAGLYIRENMLVLCPGIGAQGGEAQELWKYFGRDRVIANVGRSLMLPEGSDSTPEQQAEAAEHYRKMLNELRAAA